MPAPSHSGAHLARCLTGGASSAKVRARENEIPSGPITLTTLVRLQPLALSRLPAPVVRASILPRPEIRSGRGSAQKGLYFQFIALKFGMNARIEAGHRKYLADRTRKPRGRAPREEIDLGAGLLHRRCIPGAPLTQHDMAAWWGCSQGYIYFLQKQALGKLRAMSDDPVLREFLDEALAR